MQAGPGGYWVGLPNDAAPPAFVLTTVLGRMIAAIPLYRAE
jgi:hypothetical protein